MSIQSVLRPVGPMRIYSPAELADIVPYDGQEVLLQAEDTPNTLWGLKWNAGSAEPYQWEFIDGPPMRTFFTGSTNADNTPHDAWRNLDGGLPQLFVPRPGVYLGRYGAEIGAAADGVAAIIGIGVDGADPANDTRAFQYNTRIASVATEAEIELTSTLRVRMHYWRGDSAGNDTIFGHRYIDIIPIRVS